jgi:MFS family permease
MLFGWLGDRYGRKSNLLICSVLSLVCNVAFAFSPNFAAAIAIRSVGGVFGASYPLAKSVVNDVCTGANRAQVFAMITMSWGMGALTGPMISGLLARPALQYPNAFSQTGFWAEWPYALQAIVIGVYVFISTVATALWLPETLQRKIDTKNDISLASLAKAPGSRDASDSNEDSSDAEGDPIDSRPLTSALVSARALERGSDGNVVLLADDDDGRTATPSGADGVPDALVADKSEKPASLVPSFSVHLSPSDKVGPVPAGTITKRWQAVSIDHYTDKQRNRLIIRCVVIFSMLCFVTSARDETIPLLAMTDVASGGYGFDTAEIGGILALMGVFMLISQVIYFFTVRRFGPLVCFRGGLAVYAPTMVAWPLLSYMSRGKPEFLWPLLVLTSLLSSIANSFVFTSANVMMNTAAGAGKSGRVNGIASGLCSLLSACAPFVSSPAFSWSANHNITWIVFGVCAVCTGLMELLTIGIPKTLG